MKNYFVLIVVSILFSCASSKNNAVPKSVVGTWTPVRQEMGGKELPESFYSKQQLVLQDSIYILKAESVDQGIVRYNGNKMDIYSKEGVNAGKHFMAIYKIENNQLTICYNLMGDKYPQDFNTTASPMYFLSVFKRASK